MLEEQKVDRRDSKSGDGRPSLGPLELVEAIDLIGSKIELNSLQFACCDRHGWLLS